MNNIILEVVIKVAMDRGACLIVLLMGIEELDAKNKENRTILQLASVNRFH